MISQLDLMITVQKQNRLREEDRRARLHHLTAASAPARRHSAPDRPRVTSKVTAVARRLQWSAARPQTAKGECAQA